MTSTSIVDRAVVGASAPVAPTTAASATVLSAERIHAALERVTHPERINPVLTSLGILSWVAVAFTGLVPNHADLPLRDGEILNRTESLWTALTLGVAALAALVWAASALPGRLGAWAHARTARGSAWLLGAGVWFLFWVLSTAKSLLLKPPYFVAPQEILGGILDETTLLLESLGNSLLLLGIGFLVGLVTGLLTGVTIGWYQAANYWVNPILIFIGPVPSLAWVPIVFVLAPTAYSGAVFMIALSVWFPVSVLTRAGVLSVPKAYFDVAQTAGARAWFLVLRVSLPAALPSIFTGLFMALGASFASLVVAESFGVNSGLGWYLNWKKSWGDFNGLYGGIIVLILVCGVTLTLLFRVRSWVLRWEKELVRW
ncbi:ABC transporter permease [Pseudoclavibacter soli]|uniref:ABC transporter permease n=1 Tax=Pseudoclavibacter soli TaxID=452623 RepID=UPI00040B2FA9|nr:ABC transporter permease subunit [Pseudoclavibacter soli]